MAEEVKISTEKIADFCRRHHVRRLSLFGSALHGDFGPSSDLDLLIEFEPGHTPGLAFFAMERELSDLLGRDVDLNTPNFLCPHFRGEVVAEARELYVSP